MYTCFNLVFYVPFFSPTDIEFWYSQGALHLISARRINIGLQVFEEKSQCQNFEVVLGSLESSEIRNYLALLLCCTIKLMEKHSQIGCFLYLINRVLFFLLPTSKLEH